MLISLLAGSALAAPSVSVDTALPDVPSTARVFHPQYDAPVADLDSLQDDLGMVGVPQLEDVFGGMSHLIDGRRHLYVYDHGGAAYHDLDALKNRDPIAPRHPAVVMAEAEALVAAHGLDAVPGVDLLPAGVRPSTATPVDAEGVRGDTYTTHQSAAFQQYIDGLPGFGGGAYVDVVYGRDGQLALFSHAVRSLDDGPELPVVSPDAAVDRFTDRVEEGRYTIIKTSPADTGSISVTGITLGYSVPDTAMAVTALVPVYRIEGVLHGTGPDGAPVALPMVWLEPAVDGYGLPELNITAAN